MGTAAAGLRGAMGRLHCTQDPVPEAVGGDMQQLNQLGAQVGRGGVRGPRGRGVGVGRGVRGCGTGVPVGVSGGGAAGRGLRAESQASSDPEVALRDFSGVLGRGLSGDRGGAEVFGDLKEESKGLRA